MKNYLLILPLAVLLLLSACGEEIARLPINQISSEGNIHEESVTLDLMTGDEIGVWSEMDMAYDGDANVFFYIKIFNNDEEIQELSIDPRDKSISANEVKTEFNGKVKWKFTGKNTTYTVPADGSYTFDAIFTASNNVKIEKAELILKK